MASVLVVEDEAFTAMALVDELADLGHEVRDAMDGEAALGVMKSFDPDILITDLMMPTMGGGELIRQVRAMGGRAIPVVLTLQQLMHMHTMSDIIYCGAMDIKPDGANIQDCETDFVLVNNQGQERKIQVVLGECKSRKEITEQDVAHLKAVADAFPRDKFSVYLAFAKLTSFTDEEVERIKTLNDDHRLRTIMLTARDLEPLFVYERTKQEFDINEIAVSFKDMAVVTNQVFIQKKVRQPADVDAIPVIEAAVAPIEIAPLTDQPDVIAAEQADEADKS